MMRRGAFLLLSLAAAPLPAMAMEPPAGATSCSGCHGGNGMVSIDGRPPADMVATLEAFRSGAKPATVMNRLVKGFSPAEIQAIANWLAVQK
jgi:sulfide dehydrogenase cytochrome subunit